MTKHLPRVALLVLGLVSGPSLFAQPVVRLTSTASGVALKRLPDGSLGANKDSVGRPDSDPNSHWVFEPIPGLDQFFIRHVGSGRYLTAGTTSVSLEYSERSAAQLWNIERDPKYEVYRLSTPDGRYFDGGGRSLALTARASIPSDWWWGYAFSLTTVDGQPAPASVAMTANQIAAAKQQALDDANRAALLSAAQSAQGCWREDIFNADPSFYVFSFTRDALVLYSLRFDDDIVGSKDVILGSGWGVRDRVGGLFEPKNGNLTDESGATLTLDGRSATRIGPGYGNRFQMVVFSAKSSARGITEADCSRLLSAVLRQN
jgi:hypothetical protein